MLASGGISAYDQVFLMDVELKVGIDVDVMAHRLISVYRSVTPPWEPLTNAKAVKRCRRLRSVSTTYQANVVTLNGSLE